jgi:hypothetical protein
VNGVCKIAPQKKISPDMAGLTSLAIGTNRGTINLMGMYPDQIGTDKLHQTLHTHYGSVDHIRTASDGRHIFSAGADGSLFVYEVTSQVNEEKLAKKAQLAR